MQAFKALVENRWGWWRKKEAGNMMHNKSIAAALCLLAIAGCKQPAEAPKPTLHEVMVGSVDPVADVIWEASSKAYGDDGNAQDGLLSPKDWDDIAKAARKLHDGAAIIIANPDLKVVKPRTKILDEGTVPDAVTATQVEGYVDRDRRGLAAHARELSSIALAIEAAAKARNAATTVKLSEDLDEVCESCHKRFWYPDQPAPVGAKVK